MGEPPASHDTLTIVNGIFGDINRIKQFFLTPYSSREFCNAHWLTTIVLTFDDDDQTV